MKAWYFNGNKDKYELTNLDGWIQKEVNGKELAINLNQKKDIDFLISKLWKEISILKSYTSDFRLASQRNTIALQKMTFAGLIPLKKMGMSVEKNTIFVNKHLNCIDDDNELKNIYRNYAVFNYYTVSYVNILVHSLREISQAMRLGGKDYENYLSKGILINNMDLILDISKKLFHFLEVCDWTSQEIYLNIDKDNYNPKWTEEVTKKFYDYFDEIGKPNSKVNIDKFNTLRNSVQHRDILRKNNSSQVQYVPSFRSSWNLLLREQLDEGENLNDLIKTSDRYVHLIYSKSKKEYMDGFFNQNEYIDLVKFKREKYELFEMTIDILEKLVRFYQKLTLRVIKNDYKYLRITYENNK